MVEWITNWAQGIIVAVVIGTIIEMLLPKSSSSKYIKIVIGIYILFTIISPMVNSFQGDNINIIQTINLENSNNINEISTENIETENGKKILEMYKSNLEIDIQAKIQAKGYIVENVYAQIADDGKYTINKIEVGILGKQTQDSENNNVTTIVDNIENVKISISGQKDTNSKKESSLSDSEKNEIAKYINSIYDVNMNNIVVY